MYPRGQGGNISFGKLGFILLQVIVEDEKGERLTFKLNASDGLTRTKFHIVHPSTLEYPTMTVGEGKRRRKVEDTLAKKVVVPGEKETYDEAGFVRRVKLVGDELANTILSEFAKTFAKAVEKIAA